MLADLDELVIRCNDDRARQNLSEAVASYKAGAYRSSIVATWIAVVFDIIHKLQELELSGDKNAKAKIDKLQEIQATSNLEASQRFEREVLDIARDEFELISSMEHADLVRLREDRHRCAHPSMQSENEPFRPSAELARYHLRNAVDYLLSQPPVQGKAALDRLRAEISSASFPDDVPAAIEHFQAGPLKRARDALVRNLVIVITKELLLDSISPSEARHRMIALCAIKQMHTSVFEASLRDRFSDIVSQVSDDHWCRVIRYLRHVPGSWSFLNTATQNRVKRALKKSPQQYRDGMIVDALHVPELSELVTINLDLLDEETIIKQLGTETRPDLLDEAIRRFSTSDSFRMANSRGKAMVLPYVSDLNGEQRHAVLQAFFENSQVRGSWVILKILPEMLDQAKSEYEQIRNERENWQEVAKLLKGPGFGDDGENLRALIRRRLRSKPSRAPAVRNQMDS